jgi:hypothetical protein
MNTKNNKKKIILHGECMVKEIDTLPQNLEEIKVNGNELIVAPSETTGNHHVIETPPGVKFYHNSSTNKKYMVSSIPTNIKCVHENRHDTLRIPPGTYEVGSQQEFDYFAMSKQNVRD